MCFSHSDLFGRIWVSFWPFVPGKLHSLCGDGAVEGLWSFFLLAFLAFSQMWWQKRTFVLNIILALFFFLILFLVCV